MSFRTIAPRERILNAVPHDSQVFEGSEFSKTQRSWQREAADRLSDPLPFVSDHYGGVIGNAISYSKHRGGSHAVIRVYDAAGNDRDARAQGDFKEW